MLEIPDYAAQLTSALLVAVSQQVSSHLPSQQPLAPFPQETPGVVQP